MTNDVRFGSMIAACFRGCLPSARRRLGSGAALVAFVSHRTGDDLGDALLDLGIKEWIIEIMGSRRGRIVQEKFLPARSAGAR